MPQNYATNQVINSNAPINYQLPIKKQQVAAKQRKIMMQRANMSSKDQDLEGLDPATLPIEAEEFLINPSQT